MQIGSEMATLQEKNPKMDPKKRFFLKNPPGFLAFEKSSSNLTSNWPFWLKQIYQDIKFILRGLPGRCERLEIFCVQNSGKKLSRQKRLSKAVTMIWCVCAWMKKTKSSSFQCRAICCPRIGYRPPYYRGLTLPGQVGKSHQQIVRFSRQSLRSPPHSKKY